MPEKKPEPVKSSVIPGVVVDPTECPFREFRDNELSIEYWGMSPATLRTVIANKIVVKQSPDYVWVDEQTQPLPRSVRQYLHGWIRAEQLALSRWEEAETVVYEEDGSDKMSIIDMQLSHTQVLQRSAFCRRVLSICFILERADIGIVEHLWENFSFVLPDGWRPRYHIYSPGTKPGGGMQHRPQLSKNGCYLVRLYYLGAWRCVWVSDQVPVDATGAPLLPFSPMLSAAPIKPAPGRQQAPVPTVTASVVHLWPLLLCKALLKLAAPDMSSDEDSDTIEDEEMLDFKIIHSLTGCMELNRCPTGYEDLWNELKAEVPPFTWDADEDDIQTAKSKTVKKDKNTKETTARPRRSMVTITIKDTKELPPYTLPGISPGHEMDLYVSLIRDVPLKKPLPEPDVALWKYYRWVDWARRHGLYEAYAFPRTRFLKPIGFLKLSYAPHLLDVTSTETITAEFRKVHDRSPLLDKKGAKIIPTTSGAQKEELHEWILFDNISEVVKLMSVIYFPSMFNFTSAGSSPPVKNVKVPINRALDVVAPKSSPMYLQIDGPEQIILRISLNVMHPRLMFNCGAPVLDYVDPAYLILECFDWFVDPELPKPKAYVRTRGYDCVEMFFLPGRHYCRLWVHSQTNWHVELISQSSLLLGTQDLIQGASVRECPWAVYFLTNLGTAFTNLLKTTKTTTYMAIDAEFLKSYQPDLTWNEEVVGYKKNLRHWMFRKALQAFLIKRLSSIEYRDVCFVLRRYLVAPEFGLPEHKPDITNYRNIINLDPCDCTIPEPEHPEEESVRSEEMQTGEHSPEYQVSQTILDRLLTCPSLPAVSQVCELATSEQTCGMLKEEREKLVRKHEAATLLQAYWRGTMARKCLRDKVNVPPEIFKTLTEVAFGHPEALAGLMNEFFSMYPGAKSAYSVASALSGTTDLQTFTGQARITPQCKWIPYFQGTFYCHYNVKVHFALHGTLQFNTMQVYDNDTGLQLPQVFRAAKTFEIKPNFFGYMVMGHGSLTKPLGVNSEANWHLTVLSSLKDAFHVCSSPQVDFCREMPLPPATKMHVDCLFIPNRRNILGGIRLFVMQNGAVSFRAAASSPELKLVAILRVQNEDGSVKVVDKCEGTGELFWPYIKVEPATVPLTKHKSASAASRSAFSTTKDVKTTTSLQAKMYTIELSCPDGWPLTLEQWKRVEEVRNILEPPKIESALKKPPTPSKTPSARDKPAPAPAPPSRMQPHPGDAYSGLYPSAIYFDQPPLRPWLVERRRQPGINQHQPLPRPLACSHNLATRTQTPSARDKLAAPVPPSRMQPPPGDAYSGFYPSAKYFDQPPLRPWLVERRRQPGINQHQPMSRPLACSPTLATRTQTPSARDKPAPAPVPPSRMQPHPGDAYAGLYPSAKYFDQPPLRPWTPSARDKPAPAPVPPSRMQPPPGDAYSGFYPSAKYFDQPPLRPWLVERRRQPGINQHQPMSRPLACSPTLATRTQTPSARDKLAAPVPPSRMQPQPGDAYAGLYPSAKYFDQPPLRPWTPSARDKLAAPVPPSRMQPPPGDAYSGFYPSAKYFDQPPLRPWLVERRRQPGINQHQPMSRPLACSPTLATRTQTPSARDKPAPAPVPPSRMQPPPGDAYSGFYPSAKYFDQPPLRPWLVERRRQPGINQHQPMSRPLACSPTLATRTQTPSARDKLAAPVPPSRMQPQPGDAYAGLYPSAKYFDQPPLRPWVVERRLLECSVAQGGGIIAEEDHNRVLEFEAARRLWDAKEPGRNQRGAQIRKEFRDEFLDVPVIPSAKSVEEEIFEDEYMAEEFLEPRKDAPILPSPATESGLLEMSVESEQEAKYLKLPEALKDKFVPLPFIPFCLKEMVEDERLITPEMSEAAKAERLLRFERALNRMKDLQEHNKIQVLGQHRKRCNLLAKLFVDASWTPELNQVLELRDDAIALEAVALSESAQKKKMEQKKK
ncbi:uncharacterized protein LOC134791558 [Cydia splendana]|uniref:uncharacterized protein LOC134791558 n=1 Tax=Cydia splendana TaxID=1100963 RepID=UPI00300C8DF0